MASEHAINLAAHTYQKPPSNILEKNIPLPTTYTGQQLIDVRQLILDRNPGRSDEDFDLLFAALNLDRHFEPDQTYTLASDQAARIGSSALNTTRSRPSRRIAAVGVWRQTHRTN